VLIDLFQGPLARVAVDLKRIAVKMIRHILVVDMLDAHLSCIEYLRRRLKGKTYKARVHRKIIRIESMSALNEKNKKERYEKNIFGDSHGISRSYGLCR
jgi:hypothetical protein